MSDVSQTIPKVSGLRVLPLGGLGEIGMNCMVLEFENEIIVVDCGIHFSDLEQFGVEFVIPDFTYLVERKDKVAAIVITHGHEDHIGALPFVLKSGIRAPIYCSSFTSLLIRERLKEHGLEDAAELKVFKMGDRLKFRHFSVETVSVNHSIVDSAALLIDTPVGKVIHTGDFKIDAMPFYGHELDSKVFKKAGDKGVRLLLSDSTNVERHDHSLSESTIYKKFEQLFSEAKGLTIVSMFASNVGRMGQVFDIAAKQGKRIGLSGRSMEQNVRLGMEAGYLKGADKLLVNLHDLDSYARKDLIVLSTGSQGEFRSALIRIATGEHGQIKLQPHDRVVLSSKFIPGNERNIGRMINNLFKQGADVLYEAVHEIHVSGHATRPELKKMLEWTRPQFFVPIHGEYRHLVHHARLAKECGLTPERIVTATNGDIIELDEHACKIVHHMEEPRVLVEGRDGNDITKLVLKDRRQLGEKGVVFAMLVRNAESLKIISGPEITAKGLVAADQEAWLIEEAKALVNKVIHEYEQKISQGQYNMDLQETIRIELRRFFNANIGRKPIVLPMILDL